jgi:hypothetical protein
LIDFDYTNGTCRLVKDSSQNSKNPIIKQIEITS